MTFWIFLAVLCRAFFWWHWPIFEFQLRSSPSAISGWSIVQPITSLLATPCWWDPARSNQVSTVAILGFQFGLYHVFVSLRVQRSNQPRTIITCPVFKPQAFEQQEIARNIMTSSFQFFSMMFGLNDDCSTTFTHFSLFLISRILLVYQCSSCLSIIFRSFRRKFRCK